MATNRITRGGAMPSALAVAPSDRSTPRAIVAALATVAIAAVLAGCGGGSSTGGESTTGGSTDAAVDLSPEEAADASILNDVLARQDAVADAYAATIPHLAPGPARMASYFRAQEQEHADGVLKAMRGMGVPAEPEEESIDPGEPKTEAERLAFLYGIENTTIGDELGAISKLESSAARTLLAATVANQAQHLTLLRRALGAGPLASVPEPFENGKSEPPAG